MIRRAQRKDIERIYELGSFLHENFKQTNSLEKMLEEEFTKIFVYEKDQIVYAFLTITELYEIVDIIDLYVDETMRNQQIASRLINYMFDDISDMVQLITLEVSVDNLAAIHLYQKFGFECICKRLFYYGNVDAFLMGRRIER